MTTKELLSALEAEVTEDGYILLGRLRDELDGTFIPDGAFEAARELFGDQLYNAKARTYRALERRCRHALRVWNDKYGPVLSSEQEAYADELLTWAIRDGHARAAAAGARPLQYVQASIGRLVNHERVDAGFKSRAAELIDVSAEIAEALRPREATAA